ncbi:hypothetical protein CVT23_07865 [Minwuia thermotolerans]|uniref:SsuA/THI5-like domain-containing protein n=2 Tax=Minwuia thermotolerans TaxID=2056226 RepID=A0A2M9G3K9_9PROT|nr:hypothetical protein CVT23_07865 [Minwuia thermotolerans]
MFLPGIRFFLFSKCFLARADFAYQACSGRACLEVYALPTGHVPDGQGSTGRSLPMRIMTRVAAAAALATLPFAAGAAEGGLPDKMTWTAYGTTASGYAQSVAVGDALNKAYGVKMRVIPGKNDVSRMAPLRDGQADYCACGAAAYFGQEAAFLFASEEWGPQPLRVVMTAIGKNNLALATAKDAGIETMADLKGKRVSWVVAGDALNWNAAANMAFAGLTWDDVEKVEVSGFKASIDAIINGQSDAAFMSTVTPHAQRLAASPRGLHWAAPAA